MNSVFEEDLSEIANNNYIEWDKLKGKNILITGATGLIGSILVKAILLRNQMFNSQIKLTLIVRDIEKAKEIFNDSVYIKYIESDILNCEFINNVEYIIHAASPTKSKFLAENPVETIDISVLGTKKILDIAKKNNINSMVYLSSMEMYGVLDNENVTEEKLGYIDLKSTRSSYPESKRICELYCYSYFKEYNVPVKIARLAQTFGAGISKQENRVYKIFADGILNKSDIVLKSTGETKINFCYTTDAIIGILFLLLNGDNGESYNIVSEKTNMTILDSAKWLIEKFGNGNNNVQFDIDVNNGGYAPNNHMVLSNEKIKKLGWKSKYDIKEGYIRLLKFLEEENKNEK